MPLAAVSPILSASLADEVPGPGRGPGMVSPALSIRSFLYMTHRALRRRTGRHKSLPSWLRPPRMAGSRSSTVVVRAELVERHQPALLGPDRNFVGADGDDVELAALGGDIGRHFWRSTFPRASTHCNWMSGLDFGEVVRQLLFLHTDHVAVVDGGDGQFSVFGPRRSRRARRQTLPPEAVQISWMSSLCRSEHLLRIVGNYSQSLNLCQRAGRMPKSVTHVPHSICRIDLPFFGFQSGLLGGEQLARGALVGNEAIDGAGD